MRRRRRSRTSRSALLSTLLFGSLLPGGACALLLPELARHADDRAALAAWRVLLALPLILLPLLLALRRQQAGQRRIAIGLGASLADRLRWIWLPQLGPPLGLSLALSLLFLGAFRLLP